MGGSRGTRPATSGHAIEVRLNAENVDVGFSAAPGEIELFRLPTGPGLRVDSGVAEGDVVPPQFGSMFAKISAVGHTREEALGRLKRALAESAIAVKGGTTNRTFLLQLLDRDEVRASRVDVGWLDRASQQPLGEPGEHAGIALLQAAIEVYGAEAGAELDEFFSSAARMKPTCRPDVGRHVEIGYLGHRYQFKVYRQGVQEYRIDVAGTSIDLNVERLGPCERWLTHGEHRYRVLSLVQGYTHLVEVDGVPHRISRADAGIVRAPGPAMVVSVNVKAGDFVAAGDRLAGPGVDEDGTGGHRPVLGDGAPVTVMANAQVGSGTPLLHVDAATDSEDAEGLRVTFEGVSLRRPRAERRVSRTRAILKGVKAGIGELKRGPGHRAPGLLQNLRRLMLGFDVDPAESKRLVSEYIRASQAVEEDDLERRRAEDDLLRIFVDVSAVFGRQAAPEGGDGGGALSAEEYLYTYLRTLEARGGDLPRSFLDKLERALAHYGVDTLEPTAALRESLLWMFKSHRRADQQVDAVVAVLERRLARGGRGGRPGVPGSTRPSRHRRPQPVPGRVGRRPRRAVPRVRPAGFRAVAACHLRHDGGSPGHAGPATPTARTAGRGIAALVDCPQPLKEMFAPRFDQASPVIREVLLEVLTRRFHRIRDLGPFTGLEAGDRSVVPHRVRPRRPPHPRRRDACRRARFPARGRNAPADVAVVPGRTRRRDRLSHLDAERPGQCGRGVGGTAHPARPSRLRPVGAPGGDDGFWSGRGRGVRSDAVLHVPSGRVRLPRAEALPRIAPHDRQAARAVAAAQLPRRSAPVGRGRLSLPRRRSREHEGRAALRACRSARRDGDSRRQRDAAADPAPRADADGDDDRHSPRADTARAGRPPPVEPRALVRPPPRWRAPRGELESIARRMGVEAEGLGLQKVVVRATIPDEAGVQRDTVLRVAVGSGQGMAIQFSAPSAEPIRPLTDYAQKVVRMRQRGLTYPYELIRMLTPSGEATQADLPPGRFVEHDLGPDGQLVPVDRPYGHNTANVVVGLIANVTDKYPEGMTRVIILGDPSKEVGSLAEPECARILAALDMAERMRVPLEWFALSAGAKISMESGTENMDWIAKVLRRLIEFTQGGHEINVIVIGINVGGQPYWNAEATMLMHTRGILVMTPEGAMVLTGKTALDYSGSVSAEDNQGIGGYEHIMGPNGQAQYWARDLGEACQILLRHYDHTYVSPGERFPRRAATCDPVTRDVRVFPHGEVQGAGFALVGDIFSDEKNPGRKKPFDIRKVMRAVSDQDHEPLERWPHMRDAENAVTWDAHIGGFPVALLGFESRAVPRVGMVPPDGPEQFTSGTLFPMASKKVARFINAASAVRPLVILANLSGFDGSPESMRRRQLEWGAEIGRAVVNFSGPIVFVVISRYHGGAFVVFSKVLNENMEVVALEGTYASVIGGAPAAAVVFAREVDARTRKDPRVQALQKELDQAADAAKPALRARLSETIRSTRSEKLGQVADEFDGIHSVHRALKVGSLDRIIRASDLRPYIVDALERLMAREAQRGGAAVS